MTQIQKVALEFWLKGANFENNFKPHSDQKTSDYMKSLGHSVAKTTVFKWRNRFNWAKELDEYVKKLTSEDERVKKALGEVVKDEAVAKTIVDLERNKVLLSQGYEILELKCKQILERYKIDGKLKNEDIKLALQITQLTANREDRMLDRKVVSESLSKDDALKAISAVASAVEFDGEEIDVEVLSEIHNEKEAQ